MIEQPRRDIITVILGASRFDGLPNLDSDAITAAFCRSESEFKSYATSLSARVLDKFDSIELPDQLCLEIKTFLTSAASATDLIVYYVGHGGFVSDDTGSSTYFLALRSTTEDDKSLTGLRVSALAQLINKYAARMRAIVILDCCYAGQAARYFLGGDPIADRRSKVPFGLTLFSASASHQEAVIPPGETRTMFSGCLLDVLRGGIKNKGPLLSIKEVADSVRALIELRYPEDGVRPEVHSPRQRFGDVADCPLFPNSAFPLIKPCQEARGSHPGVRHDRSVGRSVQFCFGESGLAARTPTLACTVIENPSTVRKATERAKTRLMNSTVLRLDSSVRERLRKAGFDYSSDDIDVRRSFVGTIATLTYEAYICLADESYFRESSEERRYCELFGRLLFDRLKKHRTRQIEILISRDRESLRALLEGIVSSCIHSIDSSSRAPVRFEPVVHATAANDGCIDLTNYIAAVASNRLDETRASPEVRRDFRRIANKVRLIRRLDTNEFFSRRHRLLD